MGEAEKYFVLTQTDNLWKQHLQASRIRAAGGWPRAQKDPLIEYKLEGYNLFVEMMAQIRRNVIYSVYQFQPKRQGGAGGIQPQPAASAGRRMPSSRRWATACRGTSRAGDGGREQGLSGKSECVATDVTYTSEEGETRFMIQILLRSRFYHG